jgi:hypothetical protein
MFNRNFECTPVQNYLRQKPNWVTTKSCISAVTWVYQNKNLSEELRIYYFILYVQMNCKVNQLDHRTHKENLNINC